MAFFAWLDFELALALVGWWFYFGWIGGLPEDHSFLSFFLSFLVVYIGSYEMDIGESGGLD